MSEMDYDALESWAIAAAQELQEFVDAAQAACGDPDGDDQLPGVRELLADLDRIIGPTWPNDADGDLPAGLSDL